MSKFTKVKVHSRSVGRRCMHCRRPAIVTATRVSGHSRFKLDVRYCHEHAVELGVVQGDS